MTNQGNRRPLNPYALGTWGGSSASGHQRADTPHPPAQPSERSGGSAGAIEDPVGDAGPTGQPEDGLPAPDPDAEVSDFSRPDEFGRRALNTARAVAKRNGYYPQTRISKRRRDPRDRSATAPGYSGARPDPRDPQPLGAVLKRVLGELGWDDGMSAGRVLAEWDQIVGPAIAEHSSIVSFEDGVLVVSADSSAWAAQLRMLSPQLITTINERVGRNVVEEVRVSGPSVANWKKGKRSVTWRGPRDTYG